MLSSLRSNSKLWFYLMDVSVLVSLVLHAINCHDVVGNEVVIIYIFFMYTFLTPWLTKKFIYEGQHRSRAFFLVYTPHLIYSIWFGFWGLFHSWTIFVLYPICLILCYVNGMRSVDSIAPSSNNDMTAS